MSRYADATVYIIDDDADHLSSLKELIESISLKTKAYQSPTEFYADYDPSLWSCLLLDVRLDGFNGLDMLEEMPDKKIRIPAIMISAYAKVPMAVRAMKSGAVDFLQKPFDEQELLDRIYTALDTDKRARDNEIEEAKLAELRDRLTPREVDVMKFVVDGMSNREIAEKLELSKKTVEVHRARLMAKLEVHTVVDLVRLGLLMFRSEFENRKPPKVNV